MGEEAKQTKINAGPKKTVISNLNTIDYKKENEKLIFKLQKLLEEINYVPRSPETKFECFQKKEEFDPNYHGPVFGPKFPPLPESKSIQQINENLKKTGQEILETCVNPSLNNYLVLTNKYALLLYKFKGDNLESFNQIYENIGDYDFKLVKWLKNDDLIYRLHDYDFEIKAIGWGSNWIYVKSEKLEPKLIEYCEINLTSGPGDSGPAGEFLCKNLQTTNKSLYLGQDELDEVVGAATY